MLAIFFLIVGVSLIAISMLGLLKMKDVLLRLQVASKASTLGLIFCLLAVVAENAEVQVLTKASLTVLFLFLTTPLAAQAIAKIAHVSSRSSLHLKIDHLEKDVDGRDSRAKE